MEQRWCDANAVHVEPAIVGEISVEVAHNSVQTAVIASAGSESAPRAIFSSESIRVSNLQDFLGSRIAHGVRIGAEGKVAWVNDAGVLWEVLDRIEARTEVLARWNRWVLEYNLSIVIFWESTRTLDIR